MSINDVLDVERLVKKGEAIDRLKAALPYLRYAGQEAAELGKPKLAITSETEGGTGKVHVSLDLDLFLKDIELVLDVPPQTDKDNERASALQFAQKHNIKNWSK